MATSPRDETDRPKLSAADVLSAYSSLEKTGAAPALEQWIERFPDLREELQQALADFKERAPLADTPEQAASSGSFFHRQVEPSETPPDSSSLLSQLAPGMAVGDFRLIHKIAQGGMGQVWEALQMSLLRPVALKFIRPDRLSEQAVAFFGREARAGGRLNHPGIVTVYGSGETDGLHWIAQELVPGSCTLAHTIRDLAAADQVPSGYYRRLARFLVELTDALEFAHQCGVIHRDIKPQNVLITPDDHPKVGDFGLARLVDEASLSGPIALEGTPNYMSPEQVAAKAIGIDHRTDIFSLGAVLYEALTLRRPFASETAAQVYELILRQDPPDPHKLRPQVPKDLAAICLKALEKNRAERFQSMRAFGDELRHFLDHEPITIRRRGPLRRARRWAQRHPTSSMAAGLGLLVLGIGGWAASEVRRAGREALRQKKENLIIQADYAIENADLEEAERLMGEYRLLARGDYLPHLVLARGYSQYSRVRDAEAELEAARALGFVSPRDSEPRSAEEWYLSALELMIQAEPDLYPELIHALQEAIRLDPQMRAAYFPLYQAHKASGDLSAADRALAAFQQILATGDDYYSLVEAVRAELMGRPEDAIDVLLELEQRVDAERAKNLHIDTILGRLYLARVFEAGPDDVGRSAAELAAEEHLEAAVASAPHDAGSWANLGMLEIWRFWHDPNGPTAEDRLERATQFGRRAVEEYPRHVAGLRVLLESLFHRSRRHFDPWQADPELLEEAREVAADLRALDPGYPNLAQMEGSIELHLGMIAETRYDDAAVEAHYRRSVASDPNQVIPRLWLAQLEFDRGDHRAAFEELRVAQQVVVRYADHQAIRGLPRALRTKLDIWTFGLAGHVGTPEALDVGRSARDSIERALETAGRVDDVVEPVELLNYADFLATSPAPELNDCDEARAIFADYGLARRFAGTDLEQAATDVEALLRDCP